MNNLQQYSAPKKVTLKIVIVILALVLISGVAYGGWKILSKPEPAIKVPITESPTLKPLLQTEPDQTADWKVYTDKKYGYEIKYPPKWALKQPSAFGDVSFYDPEFVLKTDWLRGGMVNILILKNSNRFALEDFVNKITRTTHVVAQGSIAVENAKAIEVEFTDDEEREIKTVYLTEEGDFKIYVITLLYPDGIKNQQYDQIFNAMISSLQFI